jgi:hypothetical protein
MSALFIVTPMSALFIVTPDVCAVYSKFLLWIAAGISAISSSVSWGQGLQAVAR